MRFFLLLLVAVSRVNAAQADDYYSPGGSTYLELSRFDTPFTYSDGDHQARVGRFGVAYSLPLASDMDAGLQGGYATLDVSGEPQSAPVSFSGRYLGVTMDYAGTDGDYFNLSAELSYTWHEVEGDNFQAPASEIVWYETWGSFGPVLRYQRWRLSFGAYYQHLQGDETDTQPAQRLDFDTRQGLGGYLGLGFYMDPRNSLALYLTGGARQGARLVFRREF